MIYCVEVLAIYENPGVAPTAQRINRRDTDFQLAQDQVALVGKAVAPQANEYMETFGQPADTFPVSRYGFGWRCRQWIQTAGDAATVGNAIWTRLATRNLQDGTIVTVFPLDETQQVYTTGPISFRRRLPAGIDDIG